jgi:hypothetical protein
MFPYNLQNYQPRRDPEEPISDRWVKRAIAIKAHCIAKNGDAYRMIQERVEISYPPNYESWWNKEDMVIPADVRWFDVNRP